MTRLMNRAALVVLGGVPRRRWGFVPTLMPVIAERLGPARSVGWFLTNMPRYEGTLKAYGGFRTHLLCTAISLHNGCRYCVLGHATALELTYLRDHDRLFPLDEHAIATLAGLESDELRRRLGDALRQADLADEPPWVDRILELATGERTPADRDDARLMHLISMFDVLNACGIASNVEPDQVHDALNKDTELKERYARLRTESNA